MAALPPQLTSVSLHYRASCARHRRSFAMSAAFTSQPVLRGPKPRRGKPVAGLGEGEDEFPRHPCWGRPRRHPDRRRSPLRNCPSFCGSSTGCSAARAAWPSCAASVVVRLSSATVLSRDTRENWPWPGSRRCSAHQSAALPKRARVDFWSGARLPCLRSQINRRPVSGTGGALCVEVEFPAYSVPSTGKRVGLRKEPI